MYKKSQTTSTKCQYQAAASNPKWCDALNSFFIWRNKVTIKNRVPTSTCSPWNPVAMKNVDPYTLSANVNLASKYSSPCSIVKYTPNTTVITKPWYVWVKLPVINAWWAQVTLTPEEIKIIVFNKGTWKGLKTEMPNGGHNEPTSTVGANLLWKNAQKNLTKKNTSDTINRAMPQRRPSSTIDVWRPWIAPSREISRHHWIITNINVNIPKKKRLIEFMWNHDTIPVVRYKPPIEPNIGQGDSSTIWYGWHIMFDIYIYIKTKTRML